MSHSGFHDGTIGIVIEEQAAKFGRRPFLFFEDKEISYGSINENSNMAAWGLQQLGIKKGDKVGIMMRNSPEFLYAWFGLAKLGALEVPVNIELRGESLSYIINHSGMSILVLDEEFLPQINSIGNSIPVIPWVVRLGSQDSEQTRWSRSAVFDYDSVLLNGLARHLELEDVKHFDPYAIFYTSGTTGRPKGAVLPHNYAIWHARQRERVMRIAQEDVMYTCLPLSHLNAQLITVMTAWVCGAQVALVKRFSARLFWDEVRKYRATIFNIVGGMASILYKQPPSELDGVHNVRCVVGGPVPKDIYSDFKKRFHLNILEGFGMTELTPGLFVEYDNPRSNCLGLPIVDREARIVDDNDYEVPRGCVGELVFRPKTPYSMMLEYYKMPEETLKAFRNLWFHTGDYVCQDEEGYFYFVDRKKDVIRRRGENISSYEIELVLNSQQGILESAAIPVPSELGEDEIKVVIVLREGVTLSPEEFLAFCKDRLARFAIPRYIEFVSELPKTASMRVQKFKLKERWVTKTTWDSVAGRYLNP